MPEGIKETSRVEEIKPDNIMDNLEKMVTFCHPAVLFLLLSLLVLYRDFMNGKNWDFFAIYLTLSVVWILYLNWLCNSGRGVFSWIMVFLPFFLLITFIVVVKKNIGNMWNKDHHAPPA